MEDTMPTMPISAVAAWVKIISGLGTFASVAVAIVVFTWTKRKECQDREAAAYTSLDEKYVEYLKLVVEHPQLDLASRPLKNPPSLTREQQAQERAVFEILVCLMERAFLMYRDLPEGQWQGWDAYLKGWCQRENFRRLWGELGYEFDQGFMDYIGKQAA